MKAIRKAVIPVAGLGTRFLPATKAIPKEMLTIVDRPTIQYIVEEAVASGIEQIILVTSAGKSAIENHFDYDFQLDTVLKDRKKEQLREELNNISNLIDVISVRQKEPLGLGHAIWMARNVIGDEPFMVLLGDDLVMSKVACCKQMIDLYNQVGESIVAMYHGDPGYESGDPGSADTTADGPLHRLVMGRQWTYVRHTPVPDV